MTASGSSGARTSAARRTSASCTGSRTSTPSRRCRSSAPRYKPRTAQEDHHQVDRGDDSRHPARPGSTRVLCRAGQGDAQFPAPAADRAAARAAQDGRHRARAQSRESPPERRHAPRPARRGHPRSEQGARPPRSGSTSRSSPSTMATSITDLGAWGTNYTLRAIGDKLGVGGQRASIATYPVALVDDTKAPLTGSKRYVLHIPKSNLPIPVKAFWSLTMYDTNSFFVPNPLNRYDDQQPVATAHQPRRLDRHLRAARQAVRTRRWRATGCPRPGPDSDSVWSGASTTSTAPSSACSMARAGSRHPSSPAMAPATRPTGPPARPSRARRATPRRRPASAGRLACQGRRSPAVTSQRHGHPEPRRPCRQHSVSQRGDGDHAIQALNPNPAVL